MKRTAFLLLLCLLTACSAPVGFFAPEGQLQNKDLKDLLTMTGVIHEGTIDSVVTETQKQWIRRGERWDVQTTAKGWDAETRLQILELAANLGYIHSSEPMKKHYPVVLLLGAASVRVKDRLQYLIDSWRFGVRFDRLVMLGSTRSLDTPEADAALKPKVITAGFDPDEMGMMRYIYEQLKPSMPKDMQEVPVLWVQAKPGKGRARANTDDTVLAWLKEADYQVHPQDVLLAISNYPHTPYQHLVLKGILKRVLQEKAPILETVGPPSGLNKNLHEEKAPTKHAIAVLLDAMARSLYMMKKTNTMQGAATRDY